MTRSGCLAATLLGVLCVLAHGAAAAANVLRATVTQGTVTYTLWTADVTSVTAEAKCKALGGTLTSFNTKDEATKLMWGPAVQDSADASMYWTGLKVTWPSTTGRRLFGLSHDAASEVLRLTPDATALSGSTGRELSEATSEEGRGLATGLSGGRVPEEVRLWQMLRDKRSAVACGAGAHLRGSRALLGGGNSYDGDDRYNLKGAVFAWSDGSSTKLITDNLVNVAFLNCDRSQKACCGVVYDAPPDAYPGSPFPTVFFYPCASPGATASYICEVHADPPVAALPQDTKKPAGKPAATPSPTPTPKATSAPKATAAPKSRKKSPPPASNGGGGNMQASCSPGAAPIGFTNNDPNGPSTGVECVPCPRGSVSADGKGCVSCPSGKTSNKALTKCV